jgi:hypothetical protein
LLAGTRFETTIAEPKATCSADEPMPARLIISPAICGCNHRAVRSTAHKTAFSKTCRFRRVMSEALRRFSRKSGANDAPRRTFACFACRSRNLLKHYHGTGNSATRPADFHSPTNFQFFQINMKSGFEKQNFSGFTSFNPHN